MLGRSNHLHSIVLLIYLLRDFPVVCEMLGWGFDLSIPVNEWSVLDYIPSGKGFKYFSINYNNYELDNMS